MIQKEMQKIKYIAQSNRKSKYSFEFVKSEFEKRGYTLLSLENEYENTRSKLRYICQKHKDKGEQTIDFSHLYNSNRGCYYCGREKTETSRKIDIDYDSDRKIVESKGLNYIDTQKIDGKWMILYTCNKHKELGVQTKYRWFVLNKAQNGCAYCNGYPLPEWYVMDKKEKINPNIKILEPYKNMTTIMKCLCLKHNEPTNKSMQDILNGEGCKYCGAEKLSEQHFMTDEEVQRMINEKFDHIKVIKYLGIHNSNSIWFCEKHKKEFKKTLSVMLRKENESAGCDECLLERKREIYAYSLEEATELLHKIHPQVDIIGDYINTTTPTLFRCNEHNHEFTSTWDYVVSRISCCNKSRKNYKEEQVCQLIESWGYKIERGKTFKDCKDINVLPFDCYLTDFNTIVEYDGEQHFYPIKHGSQTEEDAIEKLKYTQKHDEMKNEYCNKNGINLIRIPYTEFENVDSFLFDKFVELNIIKEI